MNYLPTCTSRLVVQHLYQVSFKSKKGCRSWEDKLWCDGRTEWRNDRMTEGRTKQTLNAPLPFYGGGIKMSQPITPCRNETQILHFREVGYYNSPMGIYYGARYQVRSHVIFFFKQTFAKKICSRCSRIRYKEPFRAKHVCSCVLVIANTS